VASQFTTSAHGCVAESSGRARASTSVIFAQSGATDILLVPDLKEETDFEVCGEAENGKEGIEKALELRPDLIVLDLSMPVMNGLDAARVLKRLMPTVPLILYSAFGDRLAENQVRLIGIAEVVSKSEHASVLIHKARGLLNSPAA
jgi:two-component system, chemotaxis family, chemotaxis protein CheY